MKFLLFASALAVLSSAAAHDVSVHFVVVVHMEEVCICFGGRSMWVVWSFATYDIIMRLILSYQIINSYNKLYLQQ